MTLAARIAEYRSALAWNRGIVFEHALDKATYEERCQADSKTEAAFRACLLALAEEVPHIRKSETACTIACPACRLQAKVEEAMA